MDRSERLRRRRQRRYELKRATRKRERTDAAIAAERRYADSDKGRATRLAYEASEARATARAAYEGSDKARATRAAGSARRYDVRPIVALDGEGVTGPDGVHRYVLLAASTGERLVAAEGLSTVLVFAWLMELAQRHRGALFVGFGFDYDVNMALKDLPAEHVRTLDSNESVKAGAWFVRYRPGRYFGLRDVNTETGLTVWDVRPYWRSSFADALADTFGDVPQIITDGKARRAEFTFAQLDEIAAYNMAELELLVALVQHLRDGLNRAGIRPNRWDGPGAIATVLLRRHKVADTLEHPPPPVAEAAQNAFYGGRVECLRWGHSNRGGWQYDMRSAYPWALSAMPNWSRGTWVHHKGDPGPLPFAVYDVKWWNYYDAFAPAPLPWRSPGGGIAYPVQGRGWYWSPEVDLLREHLPNMVRWTIRDAWQFVPDDPDERPWEWIHGEFARRVQLAQAGDYAAEQALKAGLAALWGKTAQRVGYTPDPLRLPRFHHMPTAGLVTSAVRAAVFDVAFADPDAVVAIETDAVITSRRLQPRAGVHRGLLPVLGDGLGQWSEVRLDSLTYASTGAAWWDVDGVERRRTAGVSGSDVTRQRVLQAMREGSPVCDITVDRFVTMGVAAELGWDLWRTWRRESSAFPARPQGKREPVPSALPGLGRLGFQRTVCPVMPDAFSTSHPLPWTLDELELARYERRERMGVIQARDT